ncbi:MAG: cyclic nucleotide-binding domain-containing protein [Desulfobacterales bacterium]|nr:cyclic nucleotide-binding domain-containing protein [Desulfobacterales bacterium]
MISLSEMDKVEAFKGLNDNQLELLQEKCESVSFQRDDKLFSEGDNAEHLWIVTDGQVDLRFELPNDPHSHEDSTINTIGSQSSRARTLGWSCFIPPHKMRLSSYCVTRHCNVVRIKKDDLQQLFDDDPKMGYKIMTYLIQVLGYRFEQFQEEVAKDKGNSIMHSW